MDIALLSLPASLLPMDFVLILMSPLVKLLMRVFPVLFPFLSRMDLKDVTWAHSHLTEFYLFGNLG